MVAEFRRVWRNIHGRKFQVLELRIIKHITTTGCS
jgi:hypothetical protein